MGSDIGSLTLLTAEVKVIYRVLYLIRQQCGLDYMESSSEGQEGDDYDDRGRFTLSFSLSLFNSSLCTERGRPSYREENEFP